MKYSKESLLRGNNLQTGEFSDFQRFAVPVTAERFRKRVSVAILPASEPFAITPTVLQ